MPDLIDHIARISACRDRSELNRTLAQAIKDLHAPTLVRLQAVIRKDHRLSCITLVDLRSDGGDLFDEYSISSSFSQPIGDDPLLFSCVEQGQAQSEIAPGACRYMLPVVLHGVTIKVVEIDFANALGARAKKRLFGLIQLYANLLRLFDYGETDTLTGLLNRKTFEENLNRILTQVVGAEDNSDSTPFTRRQHRQKSGEEHWLCVIDIDHFKAINDNWGHIYGDEVLLLVAQLMKHSFRYEDKLFRFGGEEFVVMLQPMRSENASRAFDRFRRLIEAHDFPSVGRISVSIGFTRIQPLDTPTEIIGRADEALYYVKHHGRNGTQCYETLVEQGLLQAPTDKVMDIELF